MSKPALYPFAAIVGQDAMKLALLLAAVDWRLGVLLRGDKGSGKTTAARGLAALLPLPAPFINLPIGATEDRLLGGIHLERALKGEPALRPGLLSEAHGGVLYIDEVNLLPAHLGDALLDAAASGVHVIEREGFSASHPAQFVLLGSMNPEEGSLRPQLLDRFSLCVDVAASLQLGERQSVVERRIAFEAQSEDFSHAWQPHEERLRLQLLAAREQLGSVVCSGEMLMRISSTVCEWGVRSLRADLAAVRASRAYAAWLGDVSVTAEHVSTVLPFVLAHRARAKKDNPPPSVPQPEKSPQPEGGAQQEAPERIFTPQAVSMPIVKATLDTNNGQGPVVRTRPSEDPRELDLRATFSHAVRETGQLQPRISDLQEKVRRPEAGLRYLFVIDSSGSHAIRERMRIVKGAACSLLERSLGRRDEVVVIAFRGTSAQVVMEPTRDLQEAMSVLEYLPTGGRTPLAHALDLARQYVTSHTVLVLLTDGHANVSLRDGDPWQEALDIAMQLRCAALVIDTETGPQLFERPRHLASALRATHIPIERLQTSDDLVIALDRVSDAP
jgi:magnesium chelatase subunit D